MKSNIKRKDLVISLRYMGLDYIADLVENRTIKYVDGYFLQELLKQVNGVRNFYSKQILSLNENNLTLKNRIIELKDRIIELEKEKEVESLQKENDLFNAETSVIVAVEDDDISKALNDLF